MPFPVVRLSFDGTYNTPGEIEEDVLAQLESVEQNYGLDKPETIGSGQVRLRILLERLHQATGQRVVVLVDEYDKPILDVLDKPDLAKANRDHLRGLYGVIKGSAEHVRFVLVTGISMFSKVSLFSGLNNLSDISLDPRYASICGYTDNDIDTVFAPELRELDRDDIGRWYNGYNWRGEDGVYNPFAILHLFRNREFQPYWFESSLPTFLFEVLVTRNINPMTLEKRVANMALVSKFDIANVSVDALMFQAGYVTIVDEQRRGNRTLFTLSYPNLEVQLSVNQSLLEYVTDRGHEAEVYAEQLVGLLAKNRFEEFGKQLQAYLSGIPHQWYDVSEIERFEAHYASMLYLAFRAIEVNLVVEDPSSHGRADMVVFHAGQVFVLEFKVAQGENDVEIVMKNATTQIQERGYADKYYNRKEPIHLISLVFGRKKRNLLGIRTVAA